MYAIDGSAEIPEICMDHLSGYRNSKPVRIGNAASEQRQLDIFGPVLDAAYLYASQGGKLDEQLWSVLVKLIEYTIQHWREPDRGIWEVRSGNHEFVHSKLMAWVAVDRGIRLSKEFHMPANLSKWEITAEEIRSEILEKGYNKEIGSFTQRYDSTELDASLLMIPMAGFLPATDPRVVSTVKAISEVLTEHGLVHRYRELDDGIAGDESTFTICSFWLVENLALQGETYKAEELFNRLLKYFQPLGLIAEEIDPKNNLQLGNFPQALSHIGLINAALSLQRRKTEGPELHPTTLADRIQ
jgi:GH15 family glucan-1,4-alpha-glucosidase